MKIAETDLAWAASQNIISDEQATDLWRALRERTSEQRTFDAAHVAYYIGAFIVISAMAWFMTEAWDALNGIGLAAIALLYAIAFVGVGQLTWRSNLRVPGGLLFTLAVWMTPLVVYGVERSLGWWPQGDPGTYRDYHVWVRGSWIAMELATIAAGLIALRVRRFPFLTFPIAFALWYMSMDLTPLLLGIQEFSWNGRAWVSVVFGALMLIAAYITDLMARSRDDYAFWLYLFGLIAFWGGLTSIEGGTEATKALYCLVNLVLIGVSLFLRRRIFLVFGAIGVFGYLGHLAWTVFKDSMLFPFVLTGGGLAVIALGVALQKRRAAMETWFQKRIPEELRRLVPPQASER